jgi:hypothetical protein
MTRLFRRWYIAVVLAAILLNLSGGAVALPEETNADVVSRPDAMRSSYRATPGPPMPAGTTTIRIGDYIDGTGTHDVTAALLDFLRRVPDGSRILFEAGARYRVEGTLELVDRSRLILDGNGAEFFSTERGSANRAHWRLLGGSDLVLRRMSIRGANPDGGKPKAFHEDMQWQHGIDLRGSRRVLIDQVGVSDVYGDCVYLGSESTGAWTEDVEVREHDCRRNGRQGIGATAARRVVVHDSNLEQIGLMTIDLEPNAQSGGVTDVTVQGNRIGTGERQQFLGISGDGLIARINVQRNVLVGKALTVVVLAGKRQSITDIVVLDNRSDTAYNESGGAAMVFQGVRGLRVEHNVAPLARPGMALVALKCTTDVRVVGNTYWRGVSQVRGDATECG